MVYIKFTYIFSILLILLWVTNIYAGDTHHVKLPNGFEVILIENHQSQVISSVVTVKTGSSHEDFTNSGISHMLEHLLFNGTVNRTQEQLYSETDFYGIYNNAHTDTDYTNYIILAEKSYIERALDIQSDMLFNSIFPEDKFQKEKGIVLNEIARDRSEQSFLEDELFNMRFFHGTPYNLPVLGIPEAIKNMTREQVRDYYQRYYVPNNMTAIIMGDFDSNEMLGLIERYFGKYPPGKLPKEQPPLLRGTEEVVPFIKTEIKGITYSSMTMGMPLPWVDKDDFYGMFLITTLLDSDFKERINNNLKKNNKGEILGAGISADFNRHFSILKISVSFPVNLKPEDIERVIFEEIHKFSQEQIEMDRIQGIITSARVQEIFLSEKPHYYSMGKGKFIAASGWDFAKNFIMKLEDISKTGLEDIVKRYLSSPAFLTSLITPGDESVEGTREKMKGYYYIAKKPLKGKTENGREEFTEDSIKLVKEWKLQVSEAKPLHHKTQDSRFKTQNFQKRGVIKKVIFKNGLTLIVNSNKDSEVFAIHLIAKNRSLMEPEGKTGIVDFIHRIMEKGARDRDYKTFQKELSAIGATLKTRDSEFIPYDDIYTTHEFSYIRLETIDEYYDKGIKILSDIISKPRFEHDDIESVRSEMLNLIKKEDSKPDLLSKKLFFSEVFKGLPQSQSIIGAKEAISSITGEDLENFHSIYFSPDNIIITVSTGVEVDRVIEKFQSLFGETGRRRTNIPSIDYSKAVSHTPKSIQRELKKPLAYIRMGKFMKILPEDKTPLRILGSILSERMSFELRERQGLAYSLGAGFTFYDNYTLFSTSMGTRLETIEKSRDGMIREIEKLKGGDLKTEDLEGVINTYISSELMSTLSRINKSYYMGLAEFYKKGLDYQERQLEELKKVRLEDIKRVKERYLSIDNLIEVIIE
ncbi:MAG: pitrilysin family protein [Nitrospinota bacterium]